MQKQNHLQNDDTSSICSPTKEKVNDFIRNIQALNISSILADLSKYGQHITNRIQSQTRMSCLYFVVRQLNFNMASFLLREFIKCNTSIYSRDLYNNNLLFYVCDKQRFKMFKYLLHLGLDVNQTNIYGQSVLHQLVKNEQIQMLQYLLNSQFTLDANLKDQSKKTPLFYAVCKILVSMGASISVKDLKNHTPLYYARKKLKTQISNLLQWARKQQKKKQSVFKIKHQQEQTTQIYQVEKSKHKQKKKTKSQPKRYLKCHFKLEKSFVQHDLNRQNGLVNDWRAKARKILTEISNKQFSEFFKNPVDEALYGINDYYSSIKNPMDLSLIGSKLKHRKYLRINQFLNDINLIVDNCILYNGAGHYITSQAFKLKDYVDQAYL